MEVIIYSWIWQELLFLSLTLRNHTKFIGIKYNTPEFRDRNYGYKFVKQSRIMERIFANCLWLEQSQMHSLRFGSCLMPAKLLGKRKRAIYHMIAIERKRIRAEKRF